MGRLGKSVEAEKLVVDSEYGWNGEWLLMGMESVFQRN